MSERVFTLLKIIHTADIHLDSPFRMEDLQKAQARKIELRAAFSSLMFWAKTEQADIMLIAGDLFDSPHPTPDAVEFVVSQFASNPNCRFIISPGNHDFAASDSVYAKTTFPENVSVFTSQTLSCLHFDNIAGHAVDVYGYAFTSPILDHNPFAGVTIPQSDTITLLCGHGTLGADNGKDCPIKTEDIVRSGFDYVALGHIHNNPGIQKIENTYYGILREIPYKYSEGVVLPYPGRVLRIGIEGEDVRALQEYLNFIANTYTDIPKVNPDGIYGPSTAAQVRVFHELFDLPGNPERVTAQVWNSIISVYDDLYEGNIVNENQFPGYNI